MKMPNILAGISGYFASTSKEAPSFNLPDSEDERLYQPNTIKIMITNVPLTMPDVLSAQLRGAFEDCVVKVGGFGGVVRSDPLAVVNEDKPIAFYATHRPFVVIRELKGRVNEKCLNTVAENYINNKTYKYIESPEHAIGLLAYELNDDETDVIDAWVIPALFYSRSVTDNRGDARLIYLDLHGKVMQNEGILGFAKDLHHGVTTKAEIYARLRALTVTAVVVAP